MIAEVLIAVGAGACAVTVLSTLVGLWGLRPVSQVTFKSDGKTEAFSVTPQEIAKLREILEEDLGQRDLRSDAGRGPHQTPAHSS